MRLSAKPIKIKDSFLDPKKYERAIENFLDAAAENIRIDMQVTTQSWRHKPAFVIEKTADGGRKIYTEDVIYKYVSGGTAVRYATMTKDFVAKTQPGYIGSGPGKGGVAFINKNHPRPGIRAREFPKAIIKKWEPKWIIIFSRMQQAALA